MSNELKACNNERLTNLAISQNYQDKEIWCLPSEILGAFAYWVTAQNPNVNLIDIRSALRAFREHIVSGYFENAQIPEMFTPERLRLAINEKAFVDIPEILELNQMKPDFIDLGALARNVYYMILREHITQDDHISSRPTEAKTKIAEVMKEAVEFWEKYSWMAEKYQDRIEKEAVAMLAKMKAICDEVMR